MSSVEKKATTFNAALEVISQLYQPNKIAIACNTLSAIYPQTAYAEKIKILWKLFPVGLL